LAKVAGALALVGGVAAVVAQREALGKAKADQRELAQQAESAQRLRVENEELAGARATNEEIKRLRVNERELARLRNEVEQWRARAAEAEKMRAENERLAALEKQAAEAGQTNAPPANFLPRTQMADAGLATPEAAVETYFYAMSRGDVARLQRCQVEHWEIPPDQLESQSNSLIQQFANFPGFFITEETTVGTNQVDISVQAVAGGQVFPVHLQRVGNEWKAR